MKTRLPVYTLLLAVLLINWCRSELARAAESTTSTQPANVLFVVAESLPEELRQQIKDQVGKWSTTAPAGSRMIVVGGNNHNPIADMKLSKGDPVKRFRDLSLRKELQKITTYLDDGPSMGERLQVGIPQLAHTYWTKLGSAKNVRIVLAGTPEYHDPRHPFWSFRDFSFPADKSIVEPRTSCPLVNRAYKPIPGDVTVVLLTPRQWGSSDRHRDNVIRFLRLAFQESIGGQIVQVTNASRSLLGSINNSFEPVKLDGHPLVGMWTITRDAHIEERDDNRFDGLAAKQQPSIGSLYNPESLKREHADASDPKRNEQPSAPASDRPSQNDRDKTQPPSDTQTPPPASGPKPVSAPNVPVPAPNVPVPVPNVPVSVPTDALNTLGANPSGTMTAPLPRELPSLPTGQNPLAGDPSKRADTSSLSFVPTTSADQPSDDESANRASSDMSETGTLHQATQVQASPLDQLPQSIRQAVMQKLQAHGTASVVVIYFSSACPHAEVDLEGLQFVQHNYPRQSNSGDLETMEWGIVMSPATTDVTVNLVRTHHNVSVRFQLIEWPSAQAHETQLTFKRPGHDGKHFWSAKHQVNLGQLLASTQR